MKIIIKTTGLRLNRELEKFIEEKINDLERFSKIFGEDYFDGYFGKGKPRVEAWVEVGETTFHHKKGAFFRAECQMRFPSRSLRAEAVSEDLKLAIVEIKDELQRQIKQYKGKIFAKTKRKAKALKKESHLSPRARFYRKGRIRQEGI